MKERPLIVTTDLIPKILDGTKTKTRRVIKPQPQKPVGTAHDWEWKPAGMLCYDDYFRSHAPNYCPYGQVGDRLWVREQHHISCVGLDNGIEHRCYYSGGVYHVITPEQARSIKNWSSNRPSIHMPRWASRITLEITGIRVERLQEITIEDCIAEGCDKVIYGGNPRQDFINLWDSLNAKRGYPWEFDPWIWVIEFKEIADRENVEEGN